MIENIGINCFCPHCGNKINIQIERTGKVGGIIGGAISGAIMGSNIGIAAGPLGAIAGTIPGFVIGALLGDNIGSKIDNPICTNCNTSFKIPQKSIEEYKQRLKNVNEFIENPLTGLEIITLRAEFYTFFYRFVKLNPKEVLTKYTINEFDKNFKQYNRSTEDLYDLDVELDLNYGTTSNHLKIFHKLIYLFNLDTTYLEKISKLISDTQDGLNQPDVVAEDFKNFIFSFRKTYSEQLRNSKNPKLGLILFEQSNSNYYEEVIYYFFFTTIYLLNMHKIIEMNMEKYTFDHLKTYTVQLAEYYSDDLIEIQNRLIDKI